jgi:tetratricopeptide (TPR) repeat protein
MLGKALVGGRSRGGQALGASLDELLICAVEAHRRGDLAQSERICRQVLESDPTEPGAAQILGAILSERDESEEAIALFDAAAPRVGNLDADNVGFFNNYANALRRGKRYSQAEVLLRQIVGVESKSWHAWHNLGQVLKDSERYSEAVAPLRRATQLAPDHGPNHAVLGEVLYHLGRLRSAEVSLRRCIELGWDSDVNLWTLLGNAVRLLGDLTEAIVCFEHALKLSNGSAAARSNLAIAYGQVGRFQEAIEHAHRSIEVEPETDIMHSNASYVLLTAGEIVEGWAEWEWGLLGPRGNERPTNKPRWTPEHRDGRVLCYREQGVGDEILFASCYPDLIADASDVVIETDARVATLFARSFPGAEVRAQTINLLAGSLAESETMHDYDYAIPAGSLPGHYRTSLADFPERDSFLVADPERVAAWAARLAEIGPGPFVGMSWRSRLQTAERRLEYTQLDQWGELFAIPGVNWVNLQYDECERDLRMAERKFGVQIHRWEWLDLMNDFEEVAALTKCLDLVVAPRSAVSMLAGGLGVPTVMMGNRWDWSDLGSDTSPWFPTIQLVFRHLGEEWDPVLATAASAVRAVGESGLTPTHTNTHENH